MLLILVRRNYGRNSLVSVKYQNLHSFKEGWILLCQSILEMGRVTHLHGSALFAFLVNIILQTWHMFLHTRFTELYIFFVTRSTAFFSSTIFVIFRLVFFLIRRQYSEVVLWRSFFWWTPGKTVKEQIFTTVATLQLYWKFAVLKMFF